MGLFSGIGKSLGGVLSVAGALTGNAGLSSAGSYFGQQSTNEENRNLSREQMEFQERMSNTAHQREVTDLIEAGLNPMLSARLGGSSTPAGAMATMQNPGEAASRGAAAATQSAMNTAQVANIHQSTAKMAAEEDVARANADEIRARTPTHAVTIDKMQQDIKQSQQNIEKMIQEIKTGAASETNIQQQTKNLQEIIPQIRATVEQLRAQTKLTGAQTTLTGAQTALAGAHTAQAQAQTGLTQSETSESQQRVKADLPALENALKNLERVAEQMKMPGRQHDESVQEGFLGALSATMRALNPFNAIVPSLPIRGTGQTPQQRDTRKDWKK